MVGQSKYYMWYVESREDFFMFLAKISNTEKVELTNGNLSIKPMQHRVASRGVGSLT
jgi:hypothetical protein